MSAGIGDYSIIHGDSGAMTVVPTGKASLVLTSPPYFSEATEARLRESLRKQVEYELVVREITEFALSLRSSFEEVHRVLKSSGFLIIQTKHIRYGRYLVPLTDLHTDLALSCGFRMVSKLEWLPTHLKPERIPKFTKTKDKAHFRNLDTETFLILEKGDYAGRRSGGLVLQEDSEEWVSPLWRTQSASGRFHPFESPPEVLSRLIEIYSEPGDLVVDPFCGSGAILLAASNMGRNAIGYEIDPPYVAVAKGRLS